MSTRRKRKKSAKRVARGRKLAKSLPRDRKGKFLPRGSKNLFRKKTTRKRLRRGSVSKRRKAPTKRSKLRRTKSVPSMVSRRGKSLTTDLFPNFLSGTLVESAADAFTTTQVFTPIPRLKTIGNRATVMELLWIDAVIVTTLNAVGEGVSATFSLGSVPTALLNFEDPRVFGLIDFTIKGTIDGFMMFQNPIRIELTSVDGFGYLLASDAFHVSIDGTGTGVTNRIRWKMYYRFVSIPLTEFIGIVQSTQQS